MYSVHCTVYSVHIYVNTLHFVYDTNCIKIQNSLVSRFVIIISVTTKLSSAVDNAFNALDGLQSLPMGHNV